MKDWALVQSFFIFALFNHLSLMKYTKKQKAYLVLEDGTVYEGEGVGKTGTTTGEICFNTGMTGYQEIYTDPSYYGQIIVNTTAHIGNYGVQANEVESDSIKFSGLVTNDFSEIFSRKTGDSSLNDWFLEHGIVGIGNVDTREIVRHIRSKGAMNAIISSEILDVEELKKMLKDVPSMNGLELASKVSAKEPYFYGDESASVKVAVLDLGVKTNILRSLDERGCYMKVFPYNTTFEEMKAWSPDGFLISNGPGDPSATVDAIKTVKDILDAEIPLFGICLGHQLLALACDVPTFKLHHGHRGINHPVKNMKSGLCEITSQNHGFSVELDALSNHDSVDLTHLNLNDNTVAGIKLKEKKAFSVQYHPESSPGPHDSRYLFDEFVQLMES